MPTMMKNTKVSKYYDKIADHYEEDYSDDPYWKIYYDITWHNIKKHLPKDKSSLIIDVGGGTGYWARKIAKLGYNVVVTDISMKMLKIGRAKAKKEGLSKRLLFTYADIVDMKDQKSDRFDFVLCEGDPVSYASSQEKAIKELVRIARPDAKIVVSVKSLIGSFRFSLVHGPRNLDSLHKQHKASFDGSVPYYSFTPEEIKGLFQANSCEIISLIGKPVIVHHDYFRQNPDLATRHYKKLLDLEKRYNSHPSLVAAGGNLEIVVRKQV